MLSKIIANRSFVNFHKQSENILINLRWIFLKAFFNNLFWSILWINNLLWQLFSFWEFCLEKLMHHRNSRTTKWSLQTNMTNARNFDIFLEEFYILYNFVINIRNISMTTLWAKPIDSLSMSEWSCKKNWISKSCSWSHNSESFIFFQMITIKRNKLIIRN